jgi:transposase
MKKAQVARMLHCDPSSVGWWWERYQAEGEDSFKVKKSPGRPPKLTDYQLKKVLVVFEHIYKADLIELQNNRREAKPWFITTAEINRALLRETNIYYSFMQINRRIRALGWTLDYRYWIPPGYPNATDVARKKLNRRRLKKVLTPAQRERNFKKNMALLLSLGSDEPKQND